MSRCPPRCCIGCCDEGRKEWKIQKTADKAVNSCSDGPVPKIVEEVDKDDSEPVGTDPENTEYEEGDRIFATGLLPPPLDIRATSTVSQRLAEAFKLNSQPTDPTSRVPEYLKEFESVFSKKSFDVLPDPKPWDHAIELIPGEKPSGCKVYPLAPSEQKELDVFLQENLETGRIHPSKSPMASPVFFIKRKVEVSDWSKTTEP